MKFEIRNTSAKRLFGAGLLLVVTGAACTYTPPSGYVPDPTVGVTPVTQTGEHLDIAVVGSFASFGIGAGPISYEDGCFSPSPNSYGRRLERLLTTFAGIDTSVSILECSYGTEGLVEQAAAISPNTDVVLLENFAEDRYHTQLIACANFRQPGGDGSAGCMLDARVKEAEAAIPQDIAELSAAIAQVRLTAPSAKIVLSDMAPIFRAPPATEVLPPCESVNLVRRWERQSIANLAKTMNASIAQLASAQNVPLIKLSTLSAGRALCESANPWYREINYFDYEYVNGELAWSRFPKRAFDFTASQYRGNHVMHAAWAKAAYQLISDSGWVGHPLPALP